MTRLARDRGVTAVVGMQSRASPVFNYIRDLVAEDYLGKILSSTLVGSATAWGAYVDQPNAYLSDKANGATMLTIPFGHTIEGVCMCLGQFTEVSATTAVRRKAVTIVPEMIQQPVTSEDQIAMSGVLESGAIVSAHYRGGTSRGNNFLWEINGTKGDIVVTGDTGHAQLAELVIRGGRDDNQTMEALPVPERYMQWPQLPSMSNNVAGLYARLAEDLRSGNKTAPTFDDAVCRHRMLEAVERAAVSGTRQSIG
jgi:predicted dehydrogenase